MKCLKSAASGIVKVNCHGWRRIPRSVFRIPQSKNSPVHAGGSDFFSLRLCVSALIFFFCVLNSPAQPRSALGWVWQNPLPQGNPLFSIHFAKDKLSGFAVGADNTILRTLD